MRFCTCASDCKIFTMSFWRNEARYEKALDSIDRSPGHCVICVALWRVGDAPVELAFAATFRMASDQLLAGSRTAASQPYPVRQLGFGRRQSRTARAPGTVGQDDAGRTREASPKLGCAMW